MDLRALLELWSQRENKDIQSAYEDFVLTIDILTDFTDYLSDFKIELPIRFEYFEIQLVKLVLVSKSLAKLFEGVDIRINNKTISFPDLSSIYVLKRAQLENYMTFYYLYEDKIDEPQASFRYLLYKLSGLSKRQKFGTNGIEEYNTIKAKDRKRIDELKKRIEENNYFLNLDDKDKKRILKSQPAKEMSWERLFETSNINSDLFLTQWKLYSNYAHSEQISSMQMKAYFHNFDELVFSAYHSLETSIYPICLAIINLKNRFKEVEEKFNLLEEKIRTKIIFRRTISVNKRT